MLLFLDIQLFCIFRWGDSPIKALAVAALLRDDQVHSFITASAVTLQDRYFSGVIKYIQSSSRLQ